MHGSNVFYRNDGPALQDQFRNEAEVPSIHGPTTVPSNVENSGIDGSINGSNIERNTNSSMGPYVANFAGAQYYPVFSDVRQYQQVQPHFTGPPYPSMMSNNNGVIIGTSSNPPSPQPLNFANNPTKKRVARACDHCRKRKIKCDEVNPKTMKCSNCTKYNAQCTFKVRDDVDKRKRNSEAPEATRSKSEELNPLNFITAANMGIKARSTNGEDDYNDGTFERSDCERYARRISSNIALSGKVEKLDAKVSMIADNLAKMEWLMDKLVQSCGNVKDQGDASRPKYRQYSNTLLTPHILNWVEKELCAYDGVRKISAPVEQILSISTKWYIIQMRILADFSSPTFKNGRYKLHPLPSRAQAKRIMENFESAIVISSAPGFVTTDYYFSLIDRYYNGETLQYAESLLFHVLLCSGASRMKVSGSSDSYRLRKDRYDPSRDELRTIENNTLLNAMFFFNKVSIGRPNLISIQGLLLLSLYLQEHLDSQLAFGVFSTSARFAFELGLNRSSSHLTSSLDEEIVRRCVWWHCVNTDRMFSILLTRPPLIKDDDMDTLSDEKYYEFIKRLLREKRPAVKDEIDQLSDLKMCLDYMVSYCELLPMYLSHFVMKLIRIEAKMYEYCFTLKSTLNHSFDEIIDSIVAIRKDLNDWNTHLHPSMQLDTYKNYLSLLYVRDQMENPVLTYEVACSRVIRFHFRSMHTRVILSMFAISFLVDNSDRFKSSRHKLPNLHQLFMDEQIEYCMKILKIFMTVDYEQHMYNALLYTVLTAVFALSLYVTKHKNKEDNKRIPEIIQLLVTIHSNLIGENQEFLVSENLKWNTSVFLYTILLQNILNYYNAHNIHAKEYAFNAEPLSGMLGKLMSYSNKIKNDSLDRLMSYLKEFKVTEDTEEPGGNSKSKESGFTSTTTFLPPSPCLIADIEQGTYNFLRTPEAFPSSDGNIEGYESTYPEASENISLFPTHDFSTVYDAFSSEMTPRNLMNQDIAPAASGDIHNRAREDNDSSGLNMLFYDRDFVFPNRQRLGGYLVRNIQGGSVPKLNSMDDETR